MDDVDGDEGLSPRVRGSRDQRGVWTGRSGSIPACAGEPLDDDNTALLDQVYPPRVRGSHRPDLLVRSSPGSIPACAGEPPSVVSPPGVWRVYPRVCGGALSHGLTGLNGGGLSPRVRGSRLLTEGSILEVGSIPACAGEPLLYSTLCGHSGVYPRVCGGALAVDVDRRDAVGLSPRVRGSPDPARHAGGGAGSIPACAGEPPVQVRDRCA